MIDIERFSEVARFARKSVESGVHFAPPTKNPAALKAWERNVDITLTYRFGQEEGKDNNRHLSLESVGGIFPGENSVPLTRERIRQIVKKTTFNFWQNSPDHLQESYPWERLKKQLGKPKFLTREESITRNILEDLDSGKDYQFLSGKYPQNGLEGSRKVLQEYGITVPFYGRSYPTFIAELETVGPDTDKETLKKLLGMVSPFFTRYYPDVFDLHFTTLSQLLRNIGFYFRNPEMVIFLDKLGKASIDVGHYEYYIPSGPQQGKLNHYYVFKLQEEEIRRVLLPDPELSYFLQNPVSQIAGVRLSELPNTTQLMYGHDYKSVSSLCRQLGIRVSGSSKVRIDQLLQDCPVPIFEYDKSRRGRLERRLYYSSSGREEFKRFLLPKAARLELIKPQFVL